MTSMPRPRARNGERSLWRVFAAPTAIALASSIGLVSALVGDGLMDVMAWLGLGIPVGVSAWFVWSKRTD